MSGLIREMETIVLDVIDDTATAREIVSRIIRRFGGGAVYLPAEHYQARNEQIIELVTAGASVEAVAGRYRLHPVTVRRICRRYMAPVESHVEAQSDPARPAPKRRGRPRKQK
jgi:Mor family transcriptional regulator